MRPLGRSQELGNQKGNHRLHFHRVELIKLGESIDNFLLCLKALSVFMIMPFCDVDARVPHLPRDEVNVNAIIKENTCVCSPAIVR